MRLATPESAILSAIIFNALIIIALIPLALQGRRLPRRCRPPQLLRRNLLIYGLGGIIVPFIGIKIIDVILAVLRLAWPTGSAPRADERIPRPQVRSLALPVHGRPASVTQHHGDSHDAHHAAAQAGPDDDVILTVVTRPGLPAGDHRHRAGGLSAPGERQPDPRRQRHRDRLGADRPELHRRRGYFHGRPSVTVDADSDEDGRTTPPTRRPRTSGRPTRS